LEAGITDPPNTIWIMAENMGLDLECYGMKGVKTPNLNRMAAEGIRLDWASYLDQVEYMDGEVGFLLSELTERGMAENTVVIFIADNGRCQIRGKGYLYETGVHVPLIVWAPGLVNDQPEPVKRDQSASLIATLDVAASVLDLAGVELPEYIEGQPYLDFYRPVVHLMRRMNSAGRPHGDAAISFAEEEPLVELYDRSTDPHETVNRADDPDYSAIRDRLEAHLSRYHDDGTDTGIYDLGSREVPQCVAVDIREWLKTTDHDRWLRVERDVYVKYQAIGEEYRAATQRQR